MDASDELNKQSLGAEDCRYNREEKGGGAGELQRGFSFGACVEGEATAPSRRICRIARGSTYYIPGEITCKLLSVRSCAQPRPCVDGVVYI